MNKFNFFILLLLLIGLNSCRSIQFTNDYISASSFVKSTEPSSIEKQNWYNLDIDDDAIGYKTFNDYLLTSGTF